MPSIQQKDVQAIFMEKMQQKEFRDLFTEGQVRTGLPFQIRVMRKQRGWTQAELGTRAALPQSTIARLENPDTEHLPNVDTLLRLAAVFDVAFIARFTTYTELTAWTKDIPYTVPGLCYASLAVPPYVHTYTMTVWTRPASTAPVSARVWQDVPRSSTNAHMFNVFDLTSA